MLAGSVFLLKLQVSPRIQAIFQNLSAGLILGAIASELLPELANVQGIAGSLGTLIGFVLGLAVVFGVEKITDRIEAESGEGSEDAEGQEMTPTHGHGTQSRPSRHGGQVFRRRTQSDGAPLRVQFADDTEDPGESRLGAHSESSGSLRSVVSMRGKPKIKRELDEVTHFVSRINDLNIRLDCNASLTAEEYEEISEKIDAEVHALQYKLDRTRRLLEAEMAATGDAPFGPTLIVDTTALRNKIVNLKEAAEHLQSHIEEDEPPLGEMHEHVGDLDAMLGEFHEEVQKEITKWRRWDPAASTAGDPTVLPYGLIVTVGVDGFVDGFLIGVTCVLSSHGGVILALATCIEMCFLGAAYAPTVWRVSVESSAKRAFYVVLPCILLLIGSALGAALGDVSRDSPALFASFLAFGVVALLFLVTHELLIEAHESTKSELWWVNIWLFAGMLLVLELNRVIPGG